MNIQPNVLSDWLNITEQQNQILQIIYELEANNVDTSPKNILSKYEKSCGKNIKPNNLFTIIKTLCDNGLLVKTEKARYRVNLDGIRKRLIGTRKKQEQEFRVFDNLIENLDEKYKFIAKKSKPQISFYDTQELFNMHAKCLANANKIYVHGRLPAIALNRLVAMHRYSEKYIEVLQDRCFVKKDLEIVYITPLIPENVFALGMAAYGKPEIAVRELEMILDRLWTYIETQEKLSVYYLPETFGLNMSILEHGGKPNEFFMFLAPGTTPPSGLHVVSPEIASQARNVFTAAIERATKIEGQAGKKILTNAKRGFKRILRKKK